MSSEALIKEYFLFDFIKQRRILKNISSYFYCFNNLRYKSLFAGSEFPSRYIPCITEEL